MDLMRTIFNGLDCPKCSQVTSSKLYYKDFKFWCAYCDYSETLSMKEARKSSRSGDLLEMQVKELLNSRKCGAAGLG